ncbi:class I SAM-dependent methyltransferase [Methylocella sp.]|uniref:class I SAM-dependent methyltransferase n=1 Tax=Methylocella sp. TaxID=1978226 RepID=UPI0037848ADB
MTMKCVAEPSRHTPPAARENCPLCGGARLFKTVDFETPVMCNILFAERQTARDADRGRFTLAYCEDCSHLFNSSFQEEKISYTPNYNSSLEHSARFREFAASLAGRLNDAYGLAGKTIVEIGCGKGDFLKRLCGLADAQGIGFDTSVDDEQTPTRNVRFVQEYFGATHGRVRCDLVIGRHVLEHVGDPVGFLESLRRHPGVGADTVFYFETPNALYTLRDHGIWDLIYEHVSYFTQSSLAMAFERAGFEILDAGTAFSEQYVYVEARPRRAPARRAGTVDAGLRPLVESFRETYNRKVERWTNYISTPDAEDTVVWGAGSKGITFMNVVPGADQLRALVDLNPDKQGRFAPLHGTPVVRPDELAMRPPKSIIIMNPVYGDEIARAAAACAPAATLMLA